MIREVTMYQAVCDRCRKVFRFSWKDEGIFPSLEEAKEVIEHFEWIVNGDKCYCPDCYEYDEETNEYKPKKKED